jgi:hypothetical protein
MREASGGAQPVGSLFMKPLSPRKQIQEGEVLMDQSEIKDQIAMPSVKTSEPPIVPEPSTRSGGVFMAQACPACGTGGAPKAETATGNYVYAIGRVEARFPRQSVEKEFVQATGRAATTGLTDRQAVQSVLSERENRYLARQMCWVMTIEGLETYIMIPRDPADLDLLIGALRPTPSPVDLDCVVGVRGPIAPPEMCNGLMIPIVVFDQLYSFDRDAFIKAIPRPAQVSEDVFSPAVEEVFDRTMQMADNAGAADEHRALNYLVLRYPAIYINATEAFARNSSLSDVGVQPSTLRGSRNVVDVIFTYTNRNTDVNEKFFTRVDVTDEFPFLVTKLSPYYDR